MINKYFETHKVRQAMVSPNVDEFRCLKVSALADLAI